MTNTTTTHFDQLVKLASDFVIQQRGVWNHSAWLDLLSRVEESGINVSQDMQSSLGNMVEAINQFHTAILSIQGTTLALDKLVLDSAEFILNHKGVWGHAEWEAYCRNVSKNTIYLSEEMATYLGSILDSIKAFYIVTPPQVRTRKSSEQETREGGGKGG